MGKCPLINFDPEHFICQIRKTNTQLCNFLGGRVDGRIPIDWLCIFHCGKWRSGELLLACIIKDVKIETMLRYHHLDHQSNSIYDLFHNIGIWFAPQHWFFIILIAKNLLKKKSIARNDNCLLRIIDNVHII